MNISNINPIVIASKYKYHDDSLPYFFLNTKTYEEDKKQSYNYYTKCILNKCIAYNNHDEGYATDEEFWMMDLSVSNTIKTLIQLNSGKIEYIINSFLLNRKIFMNKLEPRELLYRKLKLLKLVSLNNIRIYNKLKYNEIIFILNKIDNLMFAVKIKAYYDGKYVTYVGGLQEKSLDMYVNAVYASITAYNKIDEEIAYISGNINANNKFYKEIYNIWSKRSIYSKNLHIKN